MFRITICTATLSLLLLPLCACGADAEPVQPEDNTHLVDASLVVYADTIDEDRADLSDIAQLSENARRIEDGTRRAGNDYIVEKSASYLDYWYRWYSCEYPSLSYQIPYEEGREVICQYFRDLAKEAEEYAEEEIGQAFQDGDTVFYTATDRCLYTWQSYSVTFAGDYLSVQYLSCTYAGGAHPLYGSRADVFDMRTGALLSPEDVFSTGEEADRLLQASIEQCAKAQQVSLSAYTMEIDDKLHYYLGEDGVTFLFNPYAYGSWADGLREVTVPYEDLQPILRIDTPYTQQELYPEITVEDGFLVEDMGESRGEDYAYTVYRLRNRYDSGDLYWEIVVERDDTVLDVLHVERDEHGDAFPASADMVLEIDANFDGINDVLICLGHFGAQGSVHYKCYLTTEDALVHCPSFSEIANPAVDREAGEILSSWRNHAGSHGHGIFALEDGAFVMTELLTVVWEQTGASTEEVTGVWTDEVLIDGQWTLRETFRGDELDEEAYREKLYGESSRWALGSERWVTLVQFNYPGRWD